MDTRMRTVNPILSVFLVSVVGLCLFSLPIIAVNAQSELSYPLNEIPDADLFEVSRYERYGHDGNSSLIQKQRTDTENAFRYLTPTEHPSVRPVVPDFQVNTDRGAVDQLRPVVVSDSAGNFTVIWYDSRNGGPDIFAQRFDATGNFIGTNYQINRDQLRGTGYIAADMNPSGELLVAWHTFPGVGYRLFDSDGSPVTGDLRLMPKSGSEHPAMLYAFDAVLTPKNDAVFLLSHTAVNDRTLLTAYRINAQGAIVDSVIVTSTTGRHNIISDAVAATIADRILFAWRNSEAKQISAQVFTEGLSPRTAPQVISGAQSAGRIRVATVNDSVFAAAWGDFTGWQIGDRMKITGRFLQTDGTTPGGLETFVTTDYFIGFDILPDSPGSLAIAWVDSTDNLFTRTWHINQQSPGPIVQINNEVGSAASKYPGIDANSRSPQSPVFVWTDQRGASDDIYFGSEISGEMVNVKVNDDLNSGVQIDSRIGVDGDGDVLMVWEDRGIGLVARLFRSDGTPRGDSFLLGSRSRLVYSANPAPAVNRSGDFAVVWKSRHKSLNLQYFSSVGTPQSAVIELADAAGAPYDHQIDIDDRGRVVVVWRQQLSSASPVEIRAQLLSPEGRPLGERITVNDTSNGGWNGLPDVTFASTGEFTVVWEYSSNGYKPCIFSAIRSQWSSAGSNSGGCGEPPALPGR